MILSHLRRRNAQNTALFHAIQKLCHKSIGNHSIDFKRNDPVASALERVGTFG